MIVPMCGPGSRLYAPTPDVVALPTFFVADFSGAEAKVPNFQHGLDDGVTYQNVNKESGLAYASTLEPSGFADSISRLNTGLADLGNDYRITVVANRVGGYTPVGSHEIEIIGRADPFSNNNCKFIEVLIPFGGGGFQVIQQPGAKGDYVLLTADGSFPTVNDDDEIWVDFIGGELFLYHNGDLYGSSDDAGIYATGQPGMGMFCRDGTPKNYCLKSWRVDAL